jgi:hypothetical protein
MDYSKRVRNYIDHDEMKKASRKKRTTSLLESTRATLQQSRGMAGQLPSRPVPVSQNGLVHY